MSWDKVKLGDISTSIQPGPFGSQLHSSDYSTEGTPIIMPKDMIDGHISHSNLAYVSDDHVNRLSRHQVHCGNLMVARKGDVRKCVFITENEEGWMTGSDCLKVALNDEMCVPRYIYYQLRSPFIGKWLETISIGSTMPSINTGLLSSIELYLPPISVQNRISEVLTDYDLIIQNNQKQIKLLEEAAQRLYKEWFVDLRFPGYEGVEIIDGKPEGWIVVNIENLCSRINAGGTPSRRNRNYWDNPSVKWFKTGELQDCWLIEPEEKISNEGLNCSSAKIFPRNTILMAIYASPTLGRLGILTSEAACNQAALCMLADEEKVSWQWLYCKLFELREDFNAVAKGAGQQNISADTVKKKEILLPTKEIIDLFSRLVDPFFIKELRLQEQNQELTEARDRLLPKLMSGEIEL